MRSPLLYLTLSLLLFTPPAWAGRAVFGQTPEQIDRSFGKYWTKLTQQDNEGQPYVTYTYSAAAFRPYFPDYPASKFTMLYRNNRVQSVFLSLYKTPADAKNAQAPVLSRESVLKQELEAKAFRVIFGYRAPTYKPLEEVTGVAPGYTNCLGDGVASVFGSNNVGTIYGFRYQYIKTCEPPYDYIKLTVIKGISGG